MPLTLFPQWSKAPLTTQNTLFGRILSFLPDNRYDLQTTNKAWHETITAPNAYELAILNFTHDILPHCRAEFRDAKPEDFTFALLSGGMTNTTLKMKYKGKSYAVRFSGRGSDTFIDRAKEREHAIIASELGINTEVLYSDPVSGNQVTRFFENAETMSAETLKNPHNIHVSNNMMRKLHQSQKPFLLDENAFERNRKFIHLITRKKPLPDYISNMIPTVNRIERLISTLDLPKVPCHNDTTPGNFLISKADPEDGRMIDHEYSGLNDPVWDSANLSMEAEFKAHQVEFQLKDYYQSDTIDPLVLQRLYLYQAVVEYYVVLWCQLQIVNHNYIGKKGFAELVALRNRRYDTFMKVIFSKEYIDAIRFFESRNDSLRGSTAIVATMGLNRVVAEAKKDHEEMDENILKEELPSPACGRREIDSNRMRITSVLSRKT